MLLLSAYMSASEVSFFSLRPIDIEEIKQANHSADESLSYLLKHSEQLLATILVGNNLANVAVVTVSAYAINSMFDFSNALAFGFFIQSIFLTFLILLFSEIMPKVYAQVSPIRFGRFSAPKMMFFYRIFAPFSRFMMRSTNVITRQVTKKHYGISVEELSKAVELTIEEKSDEQQMISDIIRFYNKTAAEIMVPRIDMIDIDFAWRFRKVLDFLVASGYSRVPVFEGTDDNIRGILYLKDLLPYKKETDAFDWHSLIRKAYFVPANKKIDAILEEFRTNRVHISIVVDEFGGTEGLLTMEDILEEIVGDITDEYDEEELPYRRDADGSYIFEAKTPLTDVIRYLELKDDTFGKLGEDVDTLGGLVLEIKQELPIPGDTVTLDPWHFVVLSMEKRRITEIRLWKDPLVSVDEKNE